ncbi:MAG: 3-hydroxyacyl-CoA dehydrogenase [Proteobacteria bacterium]|nr:3-hydroxyacyl-CoA dehydrogenase [Pseudomonadota bacterium]
MVAVNLRDFPEELHHEAKVQAAVERMTLKELIIKALTEYLEKIRKGG